MKKIIKLNLNDIEKIVKNTINEMESDDFSDTETVDIGTGEDFLVGNSTESIPDIMIGEDPITRKIMVINTKTNEVFRY
jgi:hypothetical protein